jgi:hypothetical protein
MLFNLFYDKISGNLKETEIDVEKVPDDVNIGETNDFLRQHLMIKKQGELEDTSKGDEDMSERVEQILREEVNQYMQYISKVDYVDLIRRYPSSLYKKETFDRDRVVVVKDPIYAASMFDVFGWWRSYGRENFKLIELCALIVFGKPIHNGFQERVFSRGTFTDDQLRRRMKEETFELAILEALNCNKVDKYLLRFKIKNDTDAVKIATAGEIYLKEMKKTNSDSDGESESEKIEGDDEEYNVEIDDFLDIESEDEYITEI